MYSLKGPCEIHGRFSRCSEAVVALCQYCGRRFCVRHGERLADGQEVCSREVCVAKKVDVAAHLVYKEAAMERNRSDGRPCGIDGCDSAFEGQCRRCKAYFCREHLEVHEDEITEEGMTFRTPVRLCHHCWVRRPIWQKT